MASNYPRYYSVNDRPMKIVQLESGETTVQAMNMSTGALEFDNALFARITDLSKDVQSLPEPQFNALVAKCRLEIVAKMETQAISWQPTGNGEFPFSALVNGHEFQIRVNDFPAEPLYTIVVENEPISDLEDWPIAWKKPQPRRTPRP